jgi:inorganic pyrophosphatase
MVTAYIEITPFDTIKYEVDKKTGYLRVDRPQRNNALPPTLYGFIPRTLCGRRVQSLSPDSSKGDMDPLDICVISERPINRSDILLNAKVIGGLRMVDNGEADDKIVAILENDNIWNGLDDLSQLPNIMVERLRHYFSTYKMVPGEEHHVTINEIYGRKAAQEVVKASIEDYIEEYGE